ncbi:PEP-CTERM protein-sorting domain-containing protein [Desulfomicrobium apsheronum]|uniref:PEP-CTERM protein-sorting domain-containing protein n=1 Tax=Desulfomicrobium apsheronum TaxID=52560 RepID=A0A1I3PXQ3_9BACT|nr:PEP-CTERM sorting domain-containing protein [Desulfomicrobium apsheronum]SFJ26634.1 PEP-CTERM protein-sorting domain-containing protein [Desulfomicrobium apsheronum]
MRQILFVICAVYFSMLPFSKSAHAYIYELSFLASVYGYDYTPVEMYDGTYISFTDIDPFVFTFNDKVVESGTYSSSMSYGAYYNYNINHYGFKSSVTDFLYMPEGLDVGAVSDGYAVLRNYYPTWYPSGRSQMEFNYGIKIDDWVYSAFILLDFRGIYNNLDDFLSIAPGFTAYNGFLERSAFVVDGVFSSGSIFRGDIRLFDSVKIESVPEPSTLLLLVFSILVIFFIKSARRNKYLAC